MPFFALFPGVEHFSAKMKLSQLLAIAAILTGAQAVAPLVHLGYSSYQGRSLSNGITQWLGLRYAAPPVGDLRFAAPQDPLPAEGVQDANAHGKLCLATGASGPTNTTDEDCLFLEIFAPSNATKDSKLPVYFFIQVGHLDPKIQASLIPSRAEASIS